VSLATSGGVWLLTFTPSQSCLFLLRICPWSVRAFVGMCYPGIVNTAAGQRKCTETL